MSALAEKLFERATLHTRVKDWDAALRTLTDVVRLKPDFTEAWILRGNVRMLQENHLDAALHYERALSINEHLPDAWNNLANCFGSMGMYEAARDAFTRSLQAKDSWEPYAGMGNLFCTAMDLRQAELHYKEALKRDNSAERHFQLGCVQLGQGNWKEGYPGYFYRWIDSISNPMAHNVFPRWRGEDLTGKTILLYPDQGYGDEIMTMRFASPDYLQGADRILLQTRSALSAIAKYSLGIEVIPLHGPIPRADYAVSTMDMPMALGLEWHQVGHPPYLRADPYRRGKWKDRMPKGFNVGVCWMSGGHFSTTLSIQRSKSIRVEMLRTFKLPGVNLICLQKPIMERVPDDIKLINWMDEVDDFSDTAALVDNLDLVISVDTAVAHIAAAIGKRTWNLVRFSGYWPWLAPDVCGEDRAIWYDTMRLYRQPRGGDWEQPVARIARDLKALI
jgi:tetratricopeptide (TPR) repeat protein